MMMKGVVFDLDGTLVDSLPALERSLNRALKSHGFSTFTSKEVESFIGNGVERLVRRALGESAEGYFEDVLKSFKCDYAENWSDGTIIYEGIIDCLKELSLAGKKLAVLSNKPHEFTVEIVKQLFSEIDFSLILGQREGIPHKPDPSGLREIFQQWQLAESDCVMIGDSGVDMLTAYYAGCYALGVTWGYRAEDELIKNGASHLVSNSADLTSFLLS
jgi:phosphoglycolate phosphatase